MKKHNLKEWAFRICGLELDKSLQKTNWPKKTLTNALQQYMMLDVLVLLKFLKYLPELEGYDYKNTWIPDCFHDPICTSIQLDQILIPLFLDINLKGVLIEENQLTQITNEFYKKLLYKCELLGCTLQQIRSAKKLEQFLEESGIPGMTGCLDIWPRTATGQICLGRDQLNTFLLNEDLTPECLQWFTQYFQIKTTYSEWMNAVKLFQYIDDGMLWDIFGAATGRIITQRTC